MKMEKTYSIKKISWNNNVSRVFSIIMGLVPNIIIIYFLVKNFNLSILISAIVIIALVCIYYKYAIFDWDLYLSHNKIVLKRWFSKDIVLNTETTKIKIGFIGWGITDNFNVFKVIISNQEFIVQFKLKNSFELINKPKLIERLEKAINSEIEELGNISSSILKVN